MAGPRRAAAQAGSEPGQRCALTSLLLGSPPTRDYHSPSEQHSGAPRELAHDTPLPQGGKGHTQAVAYLPLCSQGSE